MNWLWLVALLFVILVLLYSIFLRHTKLHQMIFGQRIKLLLRIKTQSEVDSFNNIKICCSSYKKCIHMKKIDKQKNYFKDVYIFNDCETQFYVLEENGKLIGHESIDPASDRVCIIELNKEDTNTIT